MSARQEELIRKQKPLTVAQAIEILLTKDRNAIVVHMDEGMYYGSCNVYEHTITESDERLGYKVKAGQKAIII